MYRRQRSRRSSFPLHAIAPSCTLNHMVQWIQANFDVSFGALSDATRRGVLEQLGRADASITALAQRFHMTLTGMKKHVGVLEQAGLVTTEKVGRVRTCRLGLRALQEEEEWIERYRQLWSARFDELDKVVEKLKRKERVDGRKKRKLSRPNEEPHDGGTEVRARTRRHTNRQRSGAPRVRGVDQGRSIQEVVGAKIVWSDPAFLRDGCSCWRRVPFGL